MPKARRAPTRPPKRSSRPRPRPAPVATPREAEPRARAVLAEAPHAHIVCRACGRIATLPLDTDSALRLEAIADRRPSGWSADLIAYSITGACPRCREGPTAPG